MFSATKFVVAGAIVALFGGLLLAGLPTQPSEEQLPAVGASADASLPSEPAVDVRDLEWRPLDLDQAAFGPGAQLEDIAASDSMLVIGGSVDGDAAVWTSTDRVNWERVPHDDAVFGGPADQEIKAIVPWRDGFVAAGEIDPRSDTDQVSRDFDPARVAAVWVSDDGRDWARVPHDEAIFGGKGRQEMFDIAASDDRLVIVGFDEEGPAAGGSDDIAVWTSADGSEWTQQTFGGGEMLAVAGTADGFVGVGHRGLWNSPDGLSWERVAPGDLQNAVVLGIAATPGGFVAVGSDPREKPGAWMSTHGVGWTPTEFAAPFSEDEFWLPQDVASADSGLAQVVGPNRYGDGSSLILVSEDGRAWEPGATSTPVSDARLRKVAAFGDHFVAIGGPRGPWEEGRVGIWTTHEPSQLSSKADIRAESAEGDTPTATTPNLLPGVDLVTEEVEPGVYRVLSDGQRDLADGPEDWWVAEDWWVDGTWADGHGTVWLSRRFDLFRLGDPASHALPDGRRLGLDADVAIAPDGVLWVAEAMPAAGLWSFDGSGWLEVDAFADRFVRGVEVTPDGTVWVLWCPDTNPNDFETCKERTRVSRSGEDGWTEVARPDHHTMLAGRYSAVHFFAVGPDRQPWISSLRSGLLRYDGEGWTVVDPAGAAPYKEDAIIDVGLDGTVWAYQRSIATGEAYLSRLADGVWTVFGEADGVPSEPFGMQGGFEGFIRAAPDGSVWLTRPRDGGFGQLLRFDGSIWVEVLEGRSPLSVAIATDGSAWVEAMSEGETSLYVITPEAVVAAE